MTRKPNFFIVGATKSGTTAMHHYLRQHPDVFMPELKECNYFSPDVGNPNFWRHEGEYLALFQDAGDATAVGEASPAYLFSKVAAERIHAFNPDARILVMARNPVDRVYSAFHHRRWQGNEDLDDFEEALAADGARLRGERMPPGIRPGEYRPYRALMEYAEPVGRYVDAFGPDAVKVILFDAFARDTAAAYAEACAFLGVDAAFRPDFEVVNESKRAKSRAVQALTRRNGFLFRTLGPLVMRTPLLRRAARAVVELNSAPNDKPPMDPETRRRLIEEVRPEVQRFSKLIGKDLSHWLEPPSAPAEGGDAP